jgi:guanylate kinase
LSNAGKLIVFAAPAGGGKSTIIKLLRAAHPEWGFSCSATTRKPRPGETNGNEYYFIDRDDFVRRIDNNEFLEHEEVHGDLYGTLKQPTDERLERGETVIFDLDVKGALNIKKFYPDALTLFIMPPSREILKQRLVDRGTEPPEVVERRLSRADLELGLAPQFDIRVINDDLVRIVAEIEGIIAQHMA